MKSHINNIVKYIFLALVRSFKKKRIRKKTIIKIEDILKAWAYSF